MPNGVLKIDLIPPLPGREKLTLAFDVTIQELYEKMKRRDWDDHLIYSLVDTVAKVIIRDYFEGGKLDDIIEETIRKVVREKVEAEVEERLEEFFS